jgi:hypothetical protein
MYWEQDQKPMPYKTQILKFIAEQGIVSIEDINRYFHPERDNSRAIRVTLYDMGVGHLRCYSPDVKNGVWYIKDQKHYQYLDFYDADFSYFRVKKPLVHLIPHYLEMNCIRTVIEQDSGLVIERWHSETYLRALPADLRKYLCSAKIPDAIFYAKNKDGSLSKYFLEYERSLKSPQRYVEIFRTYGKREDVHDQNVIYLCEPGIASRLKAIEKNKSGIGYLDSSGFNFKFIDLQQFYKTQEEKRAKRKAQIEQAMVEAKAMVTPVPTV